MWKYPSDDLMSFFGQLKCLQVWWNFPLISTPIKKFPLNFRVDSLHQQPPSPGIPRRIHDILPIG